MVFSQGSTVYRYTESNFWEKIGRIDYRRYGLGGDYLFEYLTTDNTIKIGNYELWNGYHVDQTEISND